jgi:hypothetical protein
LKLRGLFSDGLLKKKKKRRKRVLMRRPSINGMELVEGFIN